MYLRDRDNRQYVTRPNRKLTRRQIRLFNVGGRDYSIYRWRAIIVPTLFTVGVALLLDIVLNSTLIAGLLAAIGIVLTLFRYPSVHYANKAIERLIQKLVIVDCTELHRTLSPWISWISAKTVNQSSWNYAENRREEMEPFYSDLELNLIAVSARKASPEIRREAIAYLVQRFDEFVANLKARDQLITDLGRPLRKVLEDEANRVAQNVTDQQQARQDETDQRIRQIIDGVTPKGL